MRIVKLSKEDGWNQNTMGPNFAHEQRTESKPIQSFFQSKETEEIKKFKRRKSTKKKVSIWCNDDLDFEIKFGKYEKCDFFLE